MKKLLISLDKLKVQYICNDRILFPLSREQKDIYDAFGIDPPV
jgi:hypothetical protein